VGLDGLGLLAISSLLLDLLKFLEKSIVSLVDAVSVSSSLSGSQLLDELVSAKLKELLKLDASVSTLLEGLLLLSASASIDLFSLACHCLTLLFYI